MEKDWITKIMQDVTESAFKVFDKHPELGITREGYREHLKKTNPEWIPDLKEEEKQ